MIKAPVNKIIPFSSVDGPGNRLALFLQGCSFDCLYCHNPETINKCINCGCCVNVCKNNALSIENNKIKFYEVNCIQCGECIRACQNNSDPRVRYLSVDDVLKEIKKVQAFISGVTVSGGECTLYIDFLIELGKKIRDLGLTFFIDTNGSVPLWDKKELIGVIDSVMLDVKAYDRDEHIMLTGTDNDNVQKNLDFLIKSNKLYEVRTVVVPNVLDNRHTVDEVSKIIGKYDGIKYKLIKFRQMGVREDKLNSYTPSMKIMNELRKLAENNGCKDVIIT